MTAPATAPQQAAGPAPVITPEEREERERWIGVKHDYRQAFAIAQSVWPKDTPPDVVQSATATILIEYRERRWPRYARPANGGSNGQPPAEAIAPKVCPDCNGPMYDNRGDKKNPRSPDFKCKDPECGKAVWLTPPKGKKKPAA